MTGKHAESHGGPKGRRNPPTRRARPGHKHKHNTRPYCQLCHNEMTHEVDVGLPYKVRVCDRQVCRDAARRLGEG